LYLEGNLDSEILVKPWQRSSGEVQKLLHTVEISTHTGLRDRALLATLAYTFARIGSVCLSANASSRT